MSSHGTTGLFLETSLLKSFPTTTSKIKFAMCRQRVCKSVLETIRGIRRPYKAFRCQRFIIYTNPLLRTSGHNGKTGWTEQERRHKSVFVVSQDTQVQDTQTLCTWQCPYTLKGVVLHALYSSVRTYIYVRLICCQSIHGGEDRQQKELATAFSTCSSVVVKLELYNSWIMLWFRHSISLPCPEWCKLLCDSSYPSCVWRRMHLWMPWLWLVLQLLTSDRDQLY